VVPVGAENDFHHRWLKPAITSALQGSDRVIAPEGILTAFAHAPVASVVALWLDLFL
jgi:hypothetical protein